MINKIKKQIQQPENKKLLSNFISLSVLQMSGYVLSLLVLPYIIIVLGIEKFGLVIYTQALLSYFIVFTDYGFNLSATRDISINIDNPEKISEIFNSVLFTKIILGLCSFVILTGIVFCFPKLRNESLLFFSSFAMVVGQILFPVWFFRGVEQMKFITYLNVTSKLIFTGLIFLVIKVPSDYIYVNLFQGFGDIVSSFISIIFLKKRFNIKFAFPTIHQIKLELVNGWHILVSSFAVNLYMNSNIIILGFFANSIVLGYYSIAEKVMLIIRQLLGVYSQVTYPHICKLAQVGHVRLTNFYKKVFVPFLLVIIFCSLTLFLFSDKLVLFLAKGNNPNVAHLIRLIAFVPVIVCLNIPAFQTLLAYNMKKNYSFVLTTGSLISIAINPLLTYNFQATGTCISIIITELLITIGLYLILELKNKEYKLFNF